MNLASATVAIRPRSGLEALDTSIPFVLRNNRRLYVRLALVILLPAWLLTLALRYALEWHWVWVWGVAVALATLAHGVFTIAAGRLLLDRQVSAAAIFRQWLGALGSFSLLMIGRVGVYSLAAATVALLPVVVVRYAFLHEVVLLERQRVGVFKRSQQVADFAGSSAWAVVLGSLVGVAVSVVLSELVFRSVLEVALEIHLRMESLWTEGGSPFALLGLFAAVPFSAAGRFVAYIGWRAQQDGWEVQLLFQRISAGEALN